MVGSILKHCFLTISFQHIRLLTIHFLAVLCMYFNNTLGAMLLLRLPVPSLQASVLFIIIYNGLTYILKQDNF